MKPTEVIAAELQARGFTAGLIRGFFADSGEKWIKEVKRCKDEDDARELAKDMAAALESRRGSCLRAHDFSCKNCGNVFEEYFSYNPYDADVLDAALAATEPCPKCGTPSSQVTLRAPGMVTSSWLMQFGGHTYDKDDFDARVETMFAPKKDNRFFNNPNFTEQFLGDFEETAVKTMSGELPSPEPIDPSVAAEIAAALPTGV